MQLKTAVDNSTLQRRIKRKATGQPLAEAAKELSIDYQNEKSVKKKRSRALKRPPSLDHIILQDVNTDLFISWVQLKDEMPQQQRVLEIHIDASKIDEYADLRLSIALSLIHPRTDGSNSNQFHALKLAIKGDVLYTRYSYNLASPAMSNLATDQLKRLLDASLSKQERAGLAYKLTSTEKIVGQALLGIRGVKKVFITGKGTIEGKFAAMLKATLVQPPGTDITEPLSGTMANSTLQLYREGTIESGAYKSLSKLPRTTAIPRPTPSPTAKYEFSSLTVRDRSLIDEKALLLDHFVGKLSQETPSRPTRSNRKETGEFITNEEDSGGQTKRSAATPSATMTQEDGQGDELGIVDMTRIRVWSEPRGENKFILATYALSDRHNTVELGWKV